MSKQMQFFVQCQEVRRRMLERALPSQREPKKPGNPRRKKRKEVVTSHR